MRSPLRERLRRLRQKQETAFTPIFLHRPLAMLLLLPLVELPWLTPNRLTWASILVRLGAAFLFWPAGWGGVETVWAIPIALVLWHLGCVLDATDGALARYRGITTNFGRYLDKISDRLITVAFVIAIAARIQVESGGTLHWLLALLYVGTMSTVSTAKWIEIGSVPSTPATGGSSDPDERPVEGRTARGWVLFVAKNLPSILAPTELDLALWVTVAWLGGVVEWLFPALALLGVPYALAALILRGWRVARLDRQRAR